MTILPSHAAEPPAAGPRPRRRTALAWLRALRLQFWPMAWTAFALGALLAAGPAALGESRLWLGLVLIIAFEAATVFVNDRVDLETDRSNDHHGPFSGGSRVLVEGLLHPRDLVRGALACGAAGLACAAALVAAAAEPLPLAIVLAALVVLAIGYTLPPLKLCYRTLGELDVAVVHSIVMVMLGWLVAGGAPGSAAPWLASLPLGLAVLPSITLSGVPDHDADRQAGKRTLAVALGDRGALRLALAATAASAAVAATWDLLGLLGGTFDGVALPVLVHGTVIVALLGRRLARRTAPGRMDGPMAATLAYIVWFVAIPIANLV